MPSSLLRYSERHGDGEKRLYWGRADEDGAPYRGASPPFMTTDEYEQRAIRVSDVRNAFFDAKDPEQNKRYCDVLECCCNGWFKLLFIERFWNNTTQHYVEWIEYYMEDGTRTPFQVQTQMVELNNGQTNLAGHAGAHPG